MAGRWAGLTARGITSTARTTGRSNRVETPTGVVQIGILGLMRLPQSKGKTMREYVFKSKEAAHEAHRRMFYAGMPSITPVTYDASRGLYSFTAIC